MPTRSGFERVKNEFLNVQKLQEEIGGDRWTTPIFVEKFSDIPNRVGRDDIGSEKHSCVSTKGDVLRRPVHWKWFNPMCRSSPWCIEKGVEEPPPPVW